MIASETADTGENHERGTTVKIRLTALVAVLALVAAACGSDSQTATTTPSPTSAVTAGTSSGPVIEAALFGYGYDEVEVVEYVLTLDQALSMTADGDASGFGTGEYELPVDMQATLQAEMTLRYETSAGPDPGTTTLRITSEITDLAVQGTINGEPAGEADIAELGPGDIPPVDVTVVVDERGNVVDLQSNGEDFGALFSGLGGLENLGTARLGRPVGPAFPEEPVGVGDTWSETTETEGPDGPIVTRATHTVVGTEMLAGREVLVVESVYETDGFSIDFTDFLRGFFEGLAETAGDEGSAEVGDMLDQLVFRIEVAPTTNTVTSRFDPDEGLVITAEGQDDTGLAMRFKGPNEETGEMESLDLDMTISQSLTYELVDPGA